MTKTKQLKSFPGYEIHDNGMIYSLKTKRFLKPGLNHNGYRIVCLMVNGRKVMKRVSRLVCHAFKGNPPKGYTVDHENEIKTDDRESNVSWCSRRINIKRYWARRAA